MKDSSRSERLRRLGHRASMGGLLLALIWAAGPVLADRGNPSEDHFSIGVSNQYMVFTFGLAGSIEDAGLTCDTSVTCIGSWAVSNPELLTGEWWWNPPWLTKDCGPEREHPMEWTQFTTVRWRSAAATGETPEDFTDAVFGRDDGFFRLVYNNTREQKVEAAWQLNDAPVYIGSKYTLERNLVRFDYLIENLSTDTAYEVGLRSIIPTCLGGAVVGHTYRMPYTEEIRKETQIQGPDVPDCVTAFDSRANPAHNLKVVMGEHDATRPDRVVLSTFVSAFGSTWDFPLIEEFEFPRESWGSCVTMYWDPVRIAPLQSRRIVFYYGTAMAALDASGPPGQPRDKYDKNHYVLATEAPFALKFKQGDDPDTGEKETDATYLSPNPFTIDAYVYNRYEKFNFQEVSVALDLPLGLELMPGETSSKVITRINAESEGHVFWRVRATGEYTGALMYSISASPSPAYPKSISRVIEIPAQSDRKVREDWQLISVPFALTNPDPDAALGLSSYSAYTWDTFEGAYEPVEFIELGKAFWLSSGLDTTAELEGARPDAGNFNQIFMIDLEEGWNLVGLPYIYPVYWGKVRVFLSDTQEDITVKEAAERDILRDTLFWYDPYLSEPSYDWDDDVSMLLEPWRGYWIKVYHPCTLLIMPLDNIGASKGLPPGGRRSASRACAREVADGWRLQLIARGAESCDANNFIGIARSAQDSVSGEDVEKAPGFFEFVNLQVLSSGSPGRSIGLAQDLRSASDSRKTWDLEVSAKPGEKVSLTWPGIEKIDKSWSLKLVDKQGRVTKSMRSSVRHSFVMGESGTRGFQIVAEPAGRGALLVMSIDASGTRARGAAAISYALSADGDAEVAIRSLTGKTIRRLGSTRAVSGVNSQVWDFKDNRGRFVPSGMYLCEVRVRNDEGETSRGVAPMVVR